MAKKPAKTTAEVKFDGDLLRHIVEATKTTGYMHVDGARVGQLVKAGVIELNPDLTDSDGNVAARATEKGYKFIDETYGEDIVMKHDIDKSTGLEHSGAFEIDSDVVVPMRTRNVGAGRKSTYPFEQLEVGQSFHIPATEECPNPVKSRASLVTIANNKYAKTNGEYELVTVKTYAVDAKGNRLRNADGSYVPTGAKQVKRAKKTFERRFSIFPVDHSDKRGAGARIFRVS